MGKDLNISISNGQWESIFCRLHKGSLNVLTQENSYKLYSRWYRTPNVINKYNPNVSPLCWRCGTAPGTLLHIWWECPLIAAFWKDVHDLITSISTFTPDFTAEQYLLHLSSLPNSVYKGSIVVHLINAAKLCIPIKWLQTSPPRISDWIRKVDHIANMEELISQSKNSCRSFSDKWACWSNFSRSTEYLSLLNTCSAPV